MHRLQSEEILQLQTAIQDTSGVEGAEGLINYSERGRQYMDTLKGIIRTNNLDIADDAIFTNEPMLFVMGASDPPLA